MSSAYNKHGRNGSIPYSIKSETIIGSDRATDYAPSSSNSRKGSITARRSDETIVFSDIEEEEANAKVTKSAQKKKDNQVASWTSLPRKGQLALLTISRLSEPLTQTSLQSYMYYQLKSFDPSLSEAQISAQAGWLQAAFTGAQCLTAMAWGRAADNEKVGRKTVLLIGLGGTMISALGFGFSKSFAWALFFRAVGGALNGNVGIMRTMVSEIIKEKRFQSRAFMVLPMTFNVGVIIGPILGGILSDPVNQYPGIFGPKTWIGGQSGVWRMQQWPYLLPNMVSAIFLTISVCAVFMFLHETHEVLQSKPDLGRRIGDWLVTTMFRQSSKANYSALPDGEMEAEIMDLKTGHDEARGQTISQAKAKSRRVLPYRRIWSRNVVLTLIAHGVMACHVGTFNNVWFLFLSSRRYDASKPDAKSIASPFKFGGGLAMPPAHIGLALSILGLIGIFTQLIIYPRISSAWGVARSYRFFLFFFPVAYFLAPYISLIPSTSKAPDEASGFLVWLGMSFVLAVQVLARTFALPGMTILVNNSCPHPSVLGTLHGIAQSVSSGARTLGPAVAGWLYGKGLQWGYVGTVFWTMTVVALVGCVAGRFVREGSGHEIILDGEEDEDSVEMKPTVGDPKV